MAAIEEKDQLDDRKFFKDLAAKANRFVLPAGAEREEILQRQLAFLSSNLDAPAWKDEDHPDLARLGTNEWVRALRRGDPVGF